MTRWLAVFWILAACAAGILHAEDREMSERMDVLDDQQVIQPGDKVGLRILESGRPPVDCVVAKNGTIKVRDLGRVRAAGLTCKKLAYLTSQKLAALPPAAFRINIPERPPWRLLFEVIQPTKSMVPTMPPTLR